MIDKSVMLSGCDYKSMYTDAKFIMFCDNEICYEEYQAGDKVGCDFDYDRDQNIVGGMIFSNDDNIENMMRSYKYTKREYMNVTYILYFDIPDDANIFISNDDYCYISDIIIGEIVHIANCKYIDNDKFCDFLLDQNSFFISHIEKQTFTRCYKAVSDQPANIRNIKDPYTDDTTIITKEEYDELCKHIVSLGGHNITYIKRQTDDLILYGAYYHASIVRFIVRDVDFDFGEKLIKANSDILRYIDYELWTYDILKIALNDNGLLLEHVDDFTQTEELCEIAIKNNPMAIEHIHNKTDKLISLALELDASAIKFIDSNIISEDVLQKVIETQPSFIEYIKYPSVNICNIIFDKIEQDGILAFLVQSIKNPPEEIKTKMINVDPRLIVKFDSATDEELMSAIKQDIKILPSLKNPSAYVITESIKLLPEYIKYVNNPSNEMIMIALEHNIHLIFDIKKPPYSAILYVVKKDPDYIKYVKNASEELQLIAVNHNPKLLLEMLHPSDSVTLRAIELSPELIQYIPDLSEEMQIKAVTINPMIFIFIQEPSHNVCLEAIKQSGEIIEYVDCSTRTQELVNTALETYNPALNYVDDQTEELCVKIVSQDSEMIKYVKNVTINIINAAIAHDPTCIKHIDNPSVELHKKILKINSELLEHINDKTRELCMFALCTKLSRNVVEIVRQYTKYLDDDVFVGHVCLVNPSMIEYITDNNMKQECIKGLQDIKDYAKMQEIYN